MSGAETVAVLLSGIVPLLVALAGLLWWVYRRGELSGEEKARREALERSQAALERSQTEDKAKIAALERLLAETLASTQQPGRKRAPRVPE